MTAILKCDQAIFTSIRGPMGEGYRIVAASRGLRVEEKQLITRCSPSHDALCWAPEEEPSAGAWYGAGYYPLPTGRLCVAYSRYAGLEHTARGGQRVYTHNVILDAEHFPHCTYNPFEVIRAMLAAGLGEPQLKPPQTLGELTLCVERCGAGVRGDGGMASVDAGIRRAALQLLLEDQVFVLPRHESWNETVEALLLGLPGPLRAKTSFCAGLKFALARSHKVQVFRDDDALARPKVEAQSGEYLQGTRAADSDFKSNWARMVEGHWSRKAIDLLDQRTSRAFGDCGPGARERVASMYNQVDEMPSMKSQELLAIVSAQVSRTANDVEEQVRSEFVAEGRKELTARVARITVEEFGELWPALVGGLKNGGASVTFVEPLVFGALRTISTRDPLRAAEAVCDVPVAAVSKSDDNALDVALSRLCDCAASLISQHGERMSGLCARLSKLHPNLPSVKRLQTVLDSASNCAASR